MSKVKNFASSTTTYKRLLKYLKPYKGTFIIGILSMTVFGATDGLIPYFLKKILDDVFGSKNQEMLKYLVIALVVFSVVRGLFGFLEKYLSAKVGHSVVRDIRDEIFRKVLHMSVGLLEGMPSGGIISRVTNDALLVRTALTDSGASLLRDTVRVIALLTVAFYLDPFLAMLAFIGFPLCVYPVLKFGKKVKKLSRAGQEQFGGITGLLGEVISGAKVVRAFLREPWEERRFKDENERFTAVLLKSEKYGALASPTNEVLATLAVAGVIVVGALSVIKGVRTQGDFIAFITSVFLLYEPFKKLSRINTSLQSGIAAADRIFEFLDIEDAVKDDGVLELSRDIQSVRFNKIGFSYEPTSKEVLIGIDYELQAGTMLALVGMSGSGKSTLVSLLPRFYDVVSGSIEINGKDIRNYKLPSLRSQISLVGQHVFLFDDTIFNNIAYGREGVSKEEVYEAALKANATEFIDELPQGFDTRIGEQGLKLSGGQRARISIARALLKNSPILILDEATASLDNDSEEQVQKAIDQLMIGRTVIVIAHRLSTVRTANCILVMKGGKIVEKGSHEELLNVGGEYRRLYDIQFKDTE